MNFVWMVEVKNNGNWRPIYKLATPTRDAGRAEITKLACTGLEYRCVKYVWNGVR